MSTSASNVGRKSGRKMIRHRITFTKEEQARYKAICKDDPNCDYRKTISNEIKSAARRRQTLLDAAKRGYDWGMNTEEIQAMKESYE